MKIHCDSKGAFKGEDGAVIVIIALVLVVLIGFLALAIDVGRLMVAKNELQNVADAAALAGTRTLGRLYECNGDLLNCPGPMPYTDQLTYPADETAIKQAATNVASLNKAGDTSSIAVNDADIVIGIWDQPNKRVYPVTATSPDAVQVTARLDSSNNSPITTFMAKIFGVNTMDVTATATAALTGSSSMGAGGLPLPIAINKSWLSTLPCNNDLTFHPSSAGVCSAWHAYTHADPYEHNNNDLRNMIDALAALTFSSPETIAGVTNYSTTNGTEAAIFQHGNIENLFDSMKVRNDGHYDFDTNSATWTTGIPVFDDIAVGCSPRGDLLITGFTTLTITGIDPAPDKTIHATVKCDNVEPGRGGGEYYGTKGSIPGLVN